MTVGPLTLLRRLADRRPRVLVFIDLVQDIEVLLPVVLAMKRERTFAADVIISRWLQRESPRIVTLLKEHAIPFRRVRRAEVIAGRGPGLRRVRAVLTASESSHPAHAAGHALARRANEAGIATYTLQHGLENIGLSGPEAATGEFASRTVFCWFPPDALPVNLPAGVRNRLVHAGRPVLPPHPTQMACDLAVFENLHADRYSETDRDSFTAGLVGVARTGVSILVLPHPAGGWSESLRSRLSPYPNLRIVPLQERRSSRAGSRDWIAAARWVIATPSTVALDAAQLDKPVAIAAGGGAAFEPLPVLSSPQDWAAFASGGDQREGAAEAFLSRHLMPGDASARILDRLRQDLT